MKKDKITILNQDTNLLKIIAVICMTIDHIGCYLLNDNFYFRLIGRIAFPLFTYSIMIGYFKTKDIKKYALRLFILALISQIPYKLLNPNDNLNIFFTLLLELWLYRTLDKEKYYQIPLIFIIGFIFKVDYQFIYILLVPIIYYTRNNKLLFVILNLVHYGYYLFDEFYFFDRLSLTFFSVLYIPFILINTKSKIKINKYFFYIYYPLHLIIIYLIKTII
ncbi:MAG: hypothetical protein IJ966_07490 [Bacilli bacterium]|jgi:hypothetical protein|nr:hypothetical protein [Bacilli bacterium]